jgi:hypothetical protein
MMDFILKESILRYRLRRLEINRSADYGGCRFMSDADDIAYLV